MRIAVSGIGVVSALGIGVGKNLAGLKSGKSGISPRPGILSTRNVLPVGEVQLTDCQLKKLLGIAEGRIVSRTALIGALAASEAIRDAAVETEPERTGLINATSVGGMDLTEDFYPVFLGDRDSGDVELCRMHDCGASTRFIAGHCGIKGYVTAISTACSSGANAIMLGARLLQHRLLDSVVVGGTDALSRFTLNGFKSLMILDRDFCKPFDADRHGLNLGEGAGYLVLQREEDCVRKPLAWLAGYANANDAHHQTASSADGDGAYMAMSQALVRANIAADDIDYINAHGTGTANNDLSEGRAILRIYGNNAPAFSSTKGYTGHTLAAAGGIEAVFSVMSLTEGCIWPNIGYSNAMAEFNLKPQTALQQKKQRSVMSNSFGFGGNCSTLIFSAVEENWNPIGKAGAEVCENKPVMNKGNWFYINAISDGELDTDEFRALVPDAGMRRRMSRVLKLSVGAAAKCLKESGNMVPDAIITATGLGCLSDSEKFLLNTVRDNEELLNPTPFIQSTFNTAGGQVALLNANHCYNMTYVNRSSSFADVLTDALMMLGDGEAANVLAGAFDENTQTSAHILERLGVRTQGEGAFFMALGKERAPGCKGRIRLKAVGNSDDGDITAVTRARGMNFDCIDTEWFG